MQHPDRLRRPHPGVYPARVDVRLNNIEGDLGHIEADVKDLGKLWCDSNTSINNRLNTIESEIKVMTQIITENSLALDKIEERIAIMQEKIDGIN